MKGILSIILLLFLHGLLLAQAPTPHVIASEMPSILPDVSPSKKWKLVFQDEFSITKIDRSKWTFYGDEQPVVRRDGLWTSSAATLDNTGHLVMKTGINEAGQYTSACLHTEGLFEKRFGYFEIRVKLHEAEGHWPAFWLYSGAVFRIGNGGVDGAEIDIFEKFKTNRKTEHNIHWDGYDEAHEGEGKKSRCRDIMDGYHLFGLWWSEDAYRFYVDGKMVWETTAGGICDVPLNLLISDEVGSHKRMKSIEKASLPDFWYVDHVRVYDLIEQ